MKWKEWETTPIRYGIYINQKTGKMAIAYPDEDKKFTWNIDKGMTKQHPLFRAKFNIIAEGTGTFFFNKHLNGYELIERTHSWYQFTKRLPYKTNVNLFSSRIRALINEQREIEHRTIPINGIEESCLVSKTK